MAHKLSFGELQIGQPAPAATAETPFRILVLGDWQGRASKGEFERADDIAYRKPIPVDIGSLDEVLQSLSPQLNLNLPGGLPGTLRFNELDEFHPDAVVKQLDLFEEFDTLVTRLGRPQYEEQTKARLIGADHEVPASIDRRSADGARLPTVDSLAQLTEAPAVAFPSEMLEPGEVALRLSAREQAAVSSAPSNWAAGETDSEVFVQAIKAGKSAAMREVLHHPVYQGLESRWRGLQWLLKRVAKQRNVQVLILDITAEELAADLAAADDLARSGLRQFLDEHSQDQPWAVLVGLFNFDFDPVHMEVLGRIAKVAAASRSIFISGINAQTLISTDDQPAAATIEAWEELRKVAESRALGVAAPRFLLRLPFGADHRQPEEIDFEEYTGPGFSYLWGNGALATAAIAARAFVKSGWEFPPESVILQLDEAPQHVSTDADGSPLAITCEIALRASESQRLADLGLMPLLTVRGRDAIALAAVRSVSKAQPRLLEAWRTGAESSATDNASGDGSAEAELAALLNDTATEDAPADEPPAVDPAFDIDAELAALLGDAAPAEPAPAVGAASNDVDAELAALLASADEPAAPPEAVDDDLAALLAEMDAGPAAEPETAGAGNTSSPADAGAEPIDDDLAALLAEMDAPSPEGSNDASAAPAEPEAAIDDDLAALLAEMDAPSPEVAAPAAASEDAPVDDDLAALLAEMDAPAAASEEESTDESVAESEPTEGAAAAGNAGDDDFAALMAQLEATTDDDADSSAAAEEASDDAPAAGTPPEEEAPADDDFAALMAQLSASTDDASEEATESGGSAATTGEDAANERAITEEAAPPDEAPADDDLAALMASLNASTEETTPAAANLDEPPVPPESAFRSSPDESLSRESAPPIMSTTEDETGVVDIAAAVEKIQQASKYGTAGSPALLNFIDLLQPIPGAEPQGEGVPFNIRTDLEQARKEVNPDSFAPDDPLRPDEWVRADWTGIIRLTQTTLQDHAKNLLIAARLVEALTKVHGFAGLRDGLHLMRLLVEVCWDRLEPTLEDDDMEVRAGPFNWLDDADRGACFPFTIRQAPLVQFEGKNFGAIDWQQAQAAKNDEKIGAFERGIAQMQRDACQRICDDVQQCLAELKHLTQYLGRVMQGDAPGMSSMRSVIEECVTLAQQILAKKGPAASTAMTVPEGAADGEAGMMMAAGGMQQMVMVARPALSTRAEIYNHLSEAAEALERLEPHSPVPFLVRKAVQFGSLPFPELMRELIRDNNVITEMNRELGIKPPDNNNNNNNRY